MTAGCSGGRRPSRRTQSVGRRRVSSMKAIHLTAYGNPAQNLRMVEVPEPDAPSNGEALVRMEYAPGDYSDLLLANGVYFLNPQLPSVIGGAGLDAPWSPARPGSAKTTAHTIPPLSN